MIPGQVHRSSEPCGSIETHGEDGGGRDKRQFAGLPLILLGAAIGCGFFLYQLSMPAPFRGLTCCDAVIYMTQARMIVRPLGDNRFAPTPRVIQEERKTSPAAVPRTTPGARASKLRLLLQTLFSSTDKYMPGYGIFLALHILIANATGGAISWITAALVTGFILFFASEIFLWRSARRAGMDVPKWALALTLAHPALATHAALPISDTLGLSLLLIVFGLLLRTDDGLRPARRLATAALIGTLFALTIWTRSIYIVAILIFCAGWIMTACVIWIREKTVVPLLCALIASAAFALVLSPRVIACARVSGTLCIHEKTTAGSVAGEMIQRGFTGARTYSFVRPVEINAGSFITIPDPLLQAIPCTVGLESPVQALLSCALRYWYRMPGYVLVKTAGLIDNPFLSSFATYVTHPALRVLLRLLALPVLAGLVAAIWIGLRKRTPRAWRLILLFSLAYLASAVPLTIEYRYGLVFIPVGLFSAGYFSREWRASRGISLIAYGALTLLGMGFFLYKVTQWDRHDPFPYVPAQEAAASDLLKETLESVPGVMRQ